MTLEEIEERINKVRELSRSGVCDEAHGKEDDLHIDFIKYITETGTTEQKKLAKKVLSTLKLKFSRWYT